jgi:hypothetical protein
MFFRAVIDKLSQRLQNDYKVDDLKDELFDMAKPSLPHCIQLEDLVKCGVGDIIIKILIDAKGFYDYDQRETGGITEEEFDEMNIGGYAVMPSPPPLEHPNTARSNAGSTQAATATQASDKGLSGSASSDTSPEKKLRMPDGGEEAIREMVNKLWDKHDFDGLGALSKPDSNKFIKDCLINLGSSDDFSNETFEEVFTTYEKNNSGTIEKEQMVFFVA